jgi:cation transport protein ChaC
VERIEPDPGPEPGTTEHRPEDFARMAEVLLAGSPPAPLWIFAYGSLIWNPEFEIAETRPARAEGWHRSFCLSLTRWRGTREMPALMLALDRGGICDGLAFRLPEGDSAAQVIRLLEREIDANPPTNIPHWIPVETDTGPVTALTFVADPAGPAYAGGRTPAAIAWQIARAAGHWGSAAQYLYRTISMLEEHRIHDPEMWLLQALVAQEIRDLIDNRQSGLRP